MSGRSPATSGPLPLVAFSIVTLIAAGLLAVASPSVGHAVAAGLGVVLVVLGAVAMRLGGPVRGRRALPRWYVAAALAVTLLTLLARGLLSGWASGCSAAVAVGLALAPAALVTAVELPLWRALRRGLAAGITLLDTAALAPATALALDGTGTLVSGKVVSSVDPVEESHLRNLRWFAGALAHAADTPIGHAVAALAGRGNVTEAIALDDEISGSVDRHPVRLSLTSGAAGALALGGPWDVVAVEVDGRSLGSLTIADALRPDALGAIAGLRAAGTETVLVAPAEDARAAAIADQAGCALMGAAPPDATVVTASTDLLSIAGYPDAMLIGPQSPQLRLTEAAIGYAATALALCRAVVATIRRAVSLALALPAACAVLAAVGVLAPWAAATAALGSAAIVAAICWAGVKISPAV